MRERLADVLLKLAWRADSSRPVVLRREDQPTGDDWTVWCRGARLVNISPGFVREADPDWEPRFWS